MTDVDPTAADPQAATRDPLTGKFLSPKHCGAEYGLDAMRARIAELWAASASLEQRGRHAVTLAATTCLLPFLVATNFHAVGGGRLAQGLVVMASALSSLWCVWQGLVSDQSMRWHGHPRTDVTLKLCHDAPASRVVGLQMLETLGGADDLLRPDYELQVRDTDRLVKLARYTLAGQAAAAAATFALGFGAG